MARRRPHRSHGRAEALRDRLARAGLEVELDVFLAAAGGPWGRLASAGARLAAAALLLADAPLLAFALAVASAATQAAQLDGRDPLAALFARVPTLQVSAANVVARVRPHREAPDPPLLVVARLGPRARGSRGADLSAALASTALIALTLASLAVSSGALRAAALVLALEAVAALLLALGGEGTGGREEAGPPEDGSALAALVGIAERLASEGTARGVTLAAVEATVAGEHGLRRVVGRERALRRRAWVVILEDLAGPDLAIVRDGGGLVQRRSRDVLVRAAAGAALDTGDAVDILASSASPARAITLARGLPAISLTSGVAGTDGPAVGRAVEVVVAMARTTL